MTYFTPKPTGAPDSLDLRGPQIPAFELQRSCVDVEGVSVSLRTLIVALVDRRLRLRVPEPEPKAIIRVHRDTGWCPKCNAFVSLIGTSIERYCVCRATPINTPRTADVQEVLDEAVRMAMDSEKLPPWPDAPFAHKGCPNCGAPQNYEPTRRSDGVVITLEGELPPVPDAHLSTRRHWCLEPSPAR
jgi:hypothetical protein